MQIRPFLDADLPVAGGADRRDVPSVFENHVRPVYGAQLFELHHGQWQQDYRDELSTCTNPGRDDGSRSPSRRGDGGPGGLEHRHRRRERADPLLAVSQPHRAWSGGPSALPARTRGDEGDGVEVVELGTGGEDTFHTAARALHESLGFTKVPIAGYIKKI